MRGFWCSKRDFGGDPIPVVRKSFFCDFGDQPISNLWTGIFSMNAILLENGLWLKGKGKGLAFGGFHDDMVGFYGGDCTHDMGGISMAPRDGRKNEERNNND